MVVVPDDAPDVVPDDAPDDVPTTAPDDTPTDAPDDVPTDGVDVPTTTTPVLVAVVPATTPEEVVPTTTPAVGTDRWYVVVEAGATVDDICRSPVVVKSEMAKEASASTDSRLKDRSSGELE